ncbi:cytochrome P450 [Streptoalloteichus hindustanus]|uniref:Cytochrome P450 n=1 Tax=Streptoalloteichus hindustanus TaxID=2017 RepID=A0A1M5Q6L0_STRHI|nr:cytochrome P450 [Streptoalloteichus hindustanus]SHH09897.1 Cytochrome P450 [Streptoalloteichus hindustanus]
MAQPADPADDLPRFPMTRCPGFDPPGEYERLRAEDPVTPVRLRHGQRAWLVTRYADVRRVLSDPARFSSDPSRPGYPQLRPVVDRKAAPGSFLVTDPPLHTRYRRMLAHDFTAGRMAALRPRVERVVEECLAAFLASDRPADLVEGFALPIPTQVTAMLLGVPYADREFFTSRSRRHLDRSLPAEEVGAALGELESYLAGLVDAKDRDPGDDLISRMVVRHLRSGGVTRDELVGMTLLLLVGGYETTANAIALSVLALLEHRDEWVALVTDPDRVDDVVEELLRYLGLIQHGLVRAVTEDVELGGRTIRAGEGVVVALSSANRDADRFADADRLDVCRAAKGHLTFGWGVHQCIGQHLARLEMTLALRALARRAPDLRATVPLDELPFHFETPFYSVRSLPVTW